MKRYMKHARSSLAFLTIQFALLSASAVDAGSGIQIVLAGTWSGSDLKVESGSDWWGIFPEGDGFTLQSAPVTVTPARDELVDSEGEMTGRLVAVPQEARPVLLVRGLDKLTPGPLNAVRHAGPWPFLFPGQSQDLSLAPEAQGEPVYITAYGAAEPFEESLLRIRDYRLRLSRGYGSEGVRQMLVQFAQIEGSDSPCLLWAGDLDRDGKVDLLFNLQTSYVGLHLGLFLSSAAKDGELVGLVAECTASGC